MIDKAEKWDKVNKSYEEFNINIVKKKKKEIKNGENWIKKSWKI